MTFLLGQDRYSRYAELTVSVACPGYSAGGLFNRYAVGLLYREGFFDNVQPICFVTMATPHLGVRELPHTRSQRLRNDFLGGICDFYCGRSGQQVPLRVHVDRGSKSAASELITQLCPPPVPAALLQMMLVDGRDAGRHPLLLDMSLPGSIFYEGLARFPHIYLYANANRDNTGKLSVRVRTCFWCRVMRWRWSTFCVVAWQ